jgi:uncharacterized protein YciW
VTTTCKSCGSQNASDSTFCTECGSALISEDPEVQRIQAELNDAREELKLNEVEKKIDSISERLKEAEEHLSKLKSEDISASESNTLSADKQRVKRLQMQLAAAEEIAELRAQLKAELKSKDKKAAQNSYAVPNAIRKFGSDLDDEVSQAVERANTSYAVPNAIRKFGSDLDDEVSQAVERANTSYAKRERERIERLMNRRGD